MTHDWGARLEQQPDALQWCFLDNSTPPAFAALTAGHLVALVSRIFGSPAVGAPRTLIDFSATPFASALGEALSSPSFLTWGGQLRFWCQEQYDHGHELFSAAELRGADLAVFAAAQQLQLEVRAQRVWQKTWLCVSECDVDTGKEPYEHGEGDEYFGSPEKEQLSEDDGSEGSSSSGSCYQPVAVLWVRPVGKWQLDNDRAQAHAGSCVEVGRSACMLKICVPPFFVRTRT